MVLPGEDIAKHRMDPWEMEDVLHEAVDGESRMRDLQAREFIKTFRRMSSFPRAPKGIKLTRSDGTPFLSDFFNEKLLKELEDKFMMNKFETMKKDDLLKWMKRNIRSQKLEDVHFQKIFNLIDLDLDGVISFNELICYFEMELIEKYNMVNGYVAPLTDVYIKGPTREIPKSHKHLISSVIFWPSVDQNRKIEHCVGRYLSTSKEGILDVYNLNIEHLYTRTPENVMPIGFKTHVTKAVIMPDINVLVLGTMERYLRFYDVARERMDFVYEIFNYENSITAMVYKFYEDPKKKSFLAIGDTNGTITVVMFRTDTGGPFTRIPGQPVRSVRWANIRGGGEPELEVREFYKVHKRWVESLMFSEDFNCLISSSNSSPTSLALLDVHGMTVLAEISVPAGITCADVMPPPPDVSMLGLTGYDEPREPRKKIFNKWVATGGIDTKLRVWDLNDPRKPRAIMTGHISRIQFVIVQQDIADFPIILSYGRVGRITVWNGWTYEFVQVYTEGLGSLVQTKPITICYNPDFKIVILASYKILAVRLGILNDPNITAGVSHKTEISTMLYNTVYHVLITTSLASTITRWNPFTGRKEMVIPSAHYDKLVYGLKKFGITSSTFNQQQNLLATGATDGSVKLWDFFRGVPVREIQTNGPVSHILWLQTRILVVNFEKEITAWENTLKYDESHKVLSTMNKHSVLSLAFVEPSYLVVGTIDGELHFCDAASGRPLKRFMAQDPTKDLHLNADYCAALMEERMTNFIFDMKKYEECGSVGKISVTLLFLLGSRQTNRDVGKLIACLDTGVLQFYSTHPEGGYLASFYAIHRYGDLITAIASDKENKYLFTGTAQGYLKLWLISDFALPSGKKPQMAALRLQFCFLVQENWYSPAKKTNQSEPGPLLLNCYRAHTLAITSCIVIDTCRIVMTAGGDKCVRFWTIEGQFINSLNSVMSWIMINPLEPLQAVEFRIPTDLRRILSATTLKVLSRDFRCVESGDEEPEIEDDSDKRRLEARETKRTPFGTSLTLDSLGSYFKLPPQTQERVQVQLPDLDDQFVCVLKSLALLKTEKVPWIKPPRIIRSKRKRLEHTVLRNDKNECYECDDEKRERGVPDLPFKKGLSLEKGVRLRNKLKKESDKRKQKYAWRTHRKKCKEPIDTPFSTKLLGKSTGNVAGAIGDLAKGAEINLEEFDFFGFKVPSNKKDQKKFISEFMEKMAIEDNPTSRKLIKDAMLIERRKAIGKSVHELNDEEKREVFNFDCFTDKEKKELAEKRKELWGKLGGSCEGTGSSNVNGVYAVISDCLYGTKFMELSDDELINLLSDLKKPLDNMNQNSISHKFSYKRRFEWWMNQTGTKHLQHTRKYLSKENPIRLLVKKLINENSDILDISTDDAYDHVTNCVKEILNNQPCPDCGIKSKCRRQKSESEKSILSQVHFSKEDISGNKKDKLQKRRPFMALLKSCLIKTNLGEVKEDDAANRLEEFLLGVVNQFTPLCKACNKKNVEHAGYLDPYSNFKLKKTLKQFKTVANFQKPKQTRQEKKINKYCRGSELYLKRKEECGLMNVEKTFQDLKKINIDKLNDKLVRLDNEFVQIRGFTEDDKEKRRQIREEINTVKAKIEHEAKRQLE